MPADRRIRGAAGAVPTLLAVLNASPVLADPAAYDTVCAACHGEAGVGIPGIAPPLVNPELWPRLGARAADYLVGVMVAGRSGRLTVAGQDYVGLVMPVQTAHDDETLAAAAVHVLADLNKLDGIPLPNAAAVAAARATPPSNEALKALRKGG